MPFDLTFFNILHGFAGQAKILDWLGIFLANYLGYFLIIAAAILIFKQKSFSQRFYQVALVALSLILSRGLLTEIIRFLYNRPRPFEFLNFSPLINHAGGVSFPSGHAAIYFALALSVFFISKRAGVWFLIAATLIGLARIFSGVHWPLDILGGAGIGLLSVFAVKFLLQRTLKLKS